MNEMQQLLEGSTQDELLLCIELLALNIAQHRSKSGAIAFRKSMEQLRAHSAGGESGRFHAQGKIVLEEALEQVRVQHASQSNAPTDSHADATGRENRTQFRIAVNAPIKVLWPDDSFPVEASLENISWGGAVLQVAQTRAEAGDNVRVLLPGTRGASIPIEASILRTWSLPGGNGAGLAVRFYSLRPHDEAELEALLLRLAQAADHHGQRATARLTQRLDIEYNDVEELAATLDDISAGGLGITVPEPLRIGQSLQAVISTLDGSCNLKLRARVVRQNAILIRNIEFYRVGLKFEHPTEELHHSIKDLIRTIAKAKNRTDPST